jgi:hypothetical protein
MIFSAPPLRSPRLSGQCSNLNLIAEHRCVQLQADNKLQLKLNKSGSWKSQRGQATLPDLFNLNVPVDLSHTVF